MIRNLLPMTIVAGFALTALAQQDPSQRRQRDRQAANSGPNSWVWVSRMLDHMVDELQLDEQQRKEYRVIAKAKRERIRRLDLVWSEVLRAEREGDRIRAAELRAGMGEWRPEDTFSEVLDEIEPILDEVQYEWLIDLRQRRRKGLEDRDRFRRISRELPQLLDLDERQREQYPQLLKDANQRISELWYELDPLFKQLSAAQKAGDFERLAELRREMDAAHPSPEAMLGGFFDALESVLQNDQIETAVAFRKELLGSADRKERFDELAQSPETAGDQPAVPERPSEMLADPQQFRRTLLELPEELGLDPAQRAGYTRVLADLVGELWSDERPKRDELLDGFFERLENMLRPDQFEQLAAYRSKGRPSPGSAPRRQPTDFRTVLRAAKRLRLDRAQRAELRLIERDAMAARRDIDRRDKAALRNLAVMVETEIAKLLDDEQMEKFEQQLERSQRGSRH